jgi:hypothetical protein
MTPLHETAPETPLSPLPNRPSGVAHPTPFFYAGGSEQATRRHRHRFAVADHQVIEHAHADQLQRVAQLVGDRAVGRAGLGHAARVVVRVMWPVFLCAR